jgi:Xaa-Pro aminopeptidase
MRRMTSRRFAAAATIAALLTLAPLARGAPEDPGPEREPVEEPTPEIIADADALERRERRERAARNAGEDTVLAVLAPGSTSGFTGRVRSDDFHYVCPFPAAQGAVLVFQEGGVVRHHVYVLPRRQYAERWNGPTVGPGDETAARFAFDAALPVERLGPDLVALLRERSLLLASATAPSDGRERLDELLTRVKQGLEGSRPLVRRDGRRSSRDPSEPPPNAVVVRSAASLITDLRAAKSDAEIERIRRAVAATVQGLLDAGRSIAPGVGEYQVQAVIEFRCRIAGCEKQAFDSIVGSGPNSCILHYKTNRRVMQAGDLVVVDVGGEYEGYAADVTRTFPVSGRFTERQAEIYDAVLAAQKAGIEAVRPGATLRDVHAAAKAVLAEHGLDRWFLHGTSHSVGLNVHDAWSSRRELEVGSVLTVEPGVYIAEEALGVRIEDTILVTADGPVILSSGVPKERAEVEALMAESPPFELPPPR